MKNNFFHRVVFVRQISALCILCVFFGCTPVYVPNTLNTHVPTNINEVYISGHSLQNDLDFATSYAVTDNIALQFNGSISKVNTEKQNNYHKHDFFEGGLVASEIIKRKTFVSGNLSYGSGKVSSFYNFSAINNDTTLSDAEFNRVSAQLNFGYKAKNGEIIGSTRFSYVQFNTIYVPATTLQILHLKYGSLFVEPALTIKYGIPYIKFVIQTGALFSVKKNIPFSYQKYFVSLGTEIAITK